MTDPDKKIRFQQEMQLATRFVNAIQAKLDEIRRRPSAESFTLEPAERAALMQINNLGLWQGVVGGVVSLIALRRLRHKFLQRLLDHRSNLQQGGSHVSGSPFGHHGTASNPNLNSLNHVIEKRQRPLSMINLFGWFLDTSVAFGMAVTTSFVFTDRRKILSTLSTLPLMEGRSKTAEEFCPSVMQELARMRAEAGMDQGLLEHPETPYLAAMLEFEGNCRRRRAYERRLRADKGVSEHYPVSIPPPGVPADYDMDEAMSNGSGEEEEDAFSLDAGFTTDNNWTDDLTKDQEER